MSSLDRIEFKKQFFFTRNEITTFDHWNSSSIGTYILYSHGELNVTFVESDGFKLILIGDIYDYSRIEDGNSQILQSVVSSCNSREDFLRAFDIYCGSFIILCHKKSNGEICLFTDATASRELYYCWSAGELIAASQPITLNSITSLDTDDNKEAGDFFKSGAFDKKRTFFGDITNYKNVKRLKPNTYLNEKDGTVERYFPSETLQEQDMLTAAAKGADMIKGFIEAAHKRHKLAIPVSAGWESRVLLAASRDISQDVYYFVFKHAGYRDNHQDIRVPISLLKRLELRLNVLTYSKILSNEFFETVKHYVSFPRERTFQYLVNAIEKYIPDYVILNGNVSEIARMEWDDIKIRNEKVVAHLQKYPNESYAESYYKQWLGENKKVFEEFNYRVSDMLYWEENSSNWVAKTNTETRLIAEILQPFNSRELIKTLMSVDKKYRKKQNAILYKEIIRQLWPECLEEPINPGFKKGVIKLMQIMKIYGLYRNLGMRVKLLKSSITNR